MCAAHGCCHEIDGLKYEHGDLSNTPSLDLGKRFALPKKLNMERSRRALKRAATPASSRASSSISPTPEPVSTTDDEPMCVAVGEPLLSDYCVHELPLQTSSKESDTSTALSARVDYLEAETKNLTDTQKMPILFRIEEIADNDSFIKINTGFASYILFL